MKHNTHGLSLFLAMSFFGACGVNGPVDLRGIDSVKGNKNVGATPRDSNDATVQGAMADELPATAGESSEILSNFAIGENYEERIKNLEAEAEAARQERATITERVTALEEQVAINTDAIDSLKKHDEALAARIGKMEQAAIELKSWTADAVEAIKLANATGLAALEKKLREEMVDAHGALRNELLAKISGLATEFRESQASQDVKLQKLASGLSEAMARIDVVSTKITSVDTTLKGMVAELTAELKNQQETHAKAIDALKKGQEQYAKQLQNEIDAVKKDTEQRLAALTKFVNEVDATSKATAKLLANLPVNDIIERLSVVEEKARANAAATALNAAHIRENTKEIAKNSANIANNESRIRDLNAKVDAQHDEIMKIKFDLESQKSKIDSRISELRTELERVAGSNDSRHDELKKKLEAAEAERQALASELKSANEKIVGIETSIEENDAELAEYQAKIEAELADQQTQISEMALQMSDMESRYALLEEKLEAFEARVAALEVGLAAVAAQVEKLQTTVDALVFAKEIESFCAAVAVSADNSLAQVVELQRLLDKLMGPVASFGYNNLRNRFHQMKLANNVFARYHFLKDHLSFAQQMTYVATSACGSLMAMPLPVDLDKSAHKVGETVFDGNVIKYDLVSVETARKLGSLILKGTPASTEALQSILTKYQKLYPEGTKLTNDVWTTNAFATANLAASMITILKGNLDYLASVIDYKHYHTNVIPGNRPLCLFGKGTIADILNDAASARYSDIEDAVIHGKQTTFHATVQGAYYKNPTSGEVSIARYWYTGLRFVDQEEIAFEKQVNNFKRFSSDSAAQVLEASKAVNDFDQSVYSAGRYIHIVRQVNTQKIACGSSHLMMRGSLDFAWMQTRGTLDYQVSGKESCHFVRNIENVCRNNKIYFDAEQPQTWPRTHVGAIETVRLDQADPDAKYGPTNAKVYVAQPYLAAESGKWADNPLGFCEVRGDMPSERVYDDMITWGKDIDLANSFRDGYFNDPQTSTSIAGAERMALITRFCQGCSAVSFNAGTSFDGIAARDSVVSDANPARFIIPTARFKGSSTIQLPVGPDSAYRCAATHSACQTLCDTLGFEKGKIDFSRDWQTNEAKVRRASSLDWIPDLAGMASADVCGCEMERDFDE